MTARADLLALTPEALAALANRGLVKRATKDLDAGTAPEVTVDPDGTVRGRLPDGTETALPAGAGLEAATCTCAANGVCRHQIGLVLAYQRAAEQGSDQVPAGSGSGASWSPGEIDDETLARVLGERPVAAARRTLNAGYVARVHRATEADPEPSVELPTCTVRFLVPNELSYAHTDAAAGRRAEVVALAVWAFRAADERGLTGDDVRLEVGEGGPGPARDLSGTLEIADQILLDGVRHAGPLLAATLERVARDLTAQRLHWPAAAAEEIVEQLAAYRDRHAAHHAERLAELITELHARHRADGSSPRSQVLGTEESAETPLRRVRLTSLGCRVAGDEGERTAHVYLAQPDAGIVLTLKRRWAEEITGSALAGRRVAGVALGTFATANIVSESATRSASRSVRLAIGRVAKTTVTPLGRAWENLPEQIMIRDFTRAAERLSLLPPRLIRPRIEAELVRVAEIAELRQIGYHAGDQRLDAVIADGQGATAVVSISYDPVRPGALDALDAALRAEPRFVSGTLRRSRGTLIIDPIAVLGRDGVTVPDLAPGEGDAALEKAAAAGSDPLTGALDAALTACADAAHHGLAQVSPGLRGRIERTARDLEKAGLRAASAKVADLAAALAGDDTARMVRAWTDAQIRLITTAELR
ncbi:hypothetical protein J4573_26310 [Actinomadura barringtoniae]|uniref:SWIM-type domain-containing protein n=1 Tax=Actinomadura barringtoniae TaxID=1427535 RepID=A0A939PIW3_9ACTN|nr:hypothetical protein [Actinomadura barringtoniae]MBO2450644.1 hypothetical protein [Actinomadura barringtoniae]